MEPPAIQHDLLLQNDVATPLGTLRLAGAVQNGRGVETQPEMRVYGRYAVVCLLRGNGRYTDVHGVKQPLMTGNVIVVFPELGHWYRPPAGKTWDEIYVTFDGPVFDLWRQTGLLDITRPVLSVPDPNWPDRLRELVMETALLATPTGRLTQINRFLLLLGELLATKDSVLLSAANALPAWAIQAQAILDINLGETIDFTEVAASVGMSYETFRKRFLAATGTTPVRYRLERRITAARELLSYSPQLTNRQAARILGFADEFHFSRRFTQIIGITPREYRTGNR